VFEQNWLSFDSIGRRFLSRLAAGDESGARHMISYAAAKLHAFLQFHGIPCNLSIDCEFTTRIIFVPESVQSCCFLTVNAAPDKGIEVMIEYTPAARKLREVQNKKCEAVNYSLTEEGSKVILNKLLV
jgi:hypothetical protein